MHNDVLYIAHPANPSPFESEKRCLEALQIAAMEYEFDGNQQSAFDSIRECNKLMSPDLAAAIAKVAARGNVSLRVAARALQRYENA